MKGQRRHELEHNVLAEWMTVRAKQIKPYGNTILVVGLLLCVAIAISVWWTRQSDAQATEAWDAFHEALSSTRMTDFDRVVEQYPGTDVAHWAAVVVGDLRLSEGCSERFRNRSKANQALRIAVECYRMVLDESNRSDLRERATYGLARALEVQGDLDKAEQRYEELKSGWPQGVYAAAASRRLEDLGDDAFRKTFYDQFAKFDPRPPDFSEEPGAPGLGPSLDEEITPPDDERIFSAPNLLESKKQKDAGATSGETSTVLPLLTVPEAPSAEPPKSAEKAAAKPTAEPAKSADNEAAKPTAEKPKAPAADPPKPKS